MFKAPEFLSGIGKIFGRKNEKTPAVVPTSVGFSPSGPAAEIADTSVPSATSPLVSETDTNTATNLSSQANAVDSTAQDALRAVSDQLGKTDQSAQAANVGNPMPGLGPVGMPNVGKEAPLKSGQALPVTHSTSADTAPLASAATQTIDKAA